MAGSCKKLTKLKKIVKVCKNAFTMHQQYSKLVVYTLGASGTFCP